MVAVAASCILQLVTASAAHAQRDFTAFQGTVVDEEHRPLEGVTVRLTDTDRGRGRDTETNDKGEFRFRILPGEYEVTVEKEKYRGVHEVLRLRPGAPVDRDYQLVIDVTPTQEVFRQGIAAFNAGNLEEAAAAFEKAAELSPDLMQAHSNLAAAYTALGRNEDALRSLERAAELAPDSFQISVQIAAHYAQQTRYEEAIAAFEQALAGEYEMSDPAVHDAWINLGTLYFIQERTSDAIGAYEKALVSNPSSTKALLLLGKCLFNIGETTEAIAKFRQVVELAPDSADAAEAKPLIAEYEKSQNPQEPAEPQEEPADPVDPPDPQNR